MKNVSMSAGGRVTLPADARRRLGIEGAAEFEVEVDETEDALILRPVVALRREDAWAYTTEHRALLEQAHRDSREGRVRELAESELDALSE
jgi:bifunctional DNA-binding transcriptional regulator/antitoxin component of YhaV-PrlF toxin-antitoxin module